MVGLLNSAIPFTYLVLAPSHWKLASPQFLMQPRLCSALLVFFAESLVDQNQHPWHFHRFFRVSILVSGQGLTLETGKIAVLAAISASVCYGIAVSYTKKYLQDASH